MNTLFSKPDANPDTQKIEADTSEAARELVASYAIENAQSLAELLDACCGENAGDCARALARLTDADRVDPSVALDVISVARDDLSRLPCAVEPIAPDKLVRIRRADLDTAVLYHLGRLTTLANRLSPLAAS